MLENDHNRTPFSKGLLNLDVENEAEQISSFIRGSVRKKLRRRGAVVGISGGLDSSVVLALSVHALGADNVLGLLLPEQESGPESRELALKLADQFGVKTLEENITGVLEGAGCYQRRNEALRKLFPDFGAGWKAKIVISGSLLEQGTLNVFRAVVQDPNGKEYDQRMPLPVFLQIVASSNFKQRSRMMFLYYHAELRNYAVIGTPNKNETELGFFVKYGDGAMDVNPIGHLFKTQVFQLAEYLNVPAEIRQRIPTTDTYPGGSTQEEFFYRVPFDLLDSIWLGQEKGYTVEQIAAGLGLEEVQVQRVLNDIKTKKRSAEYLRTGVLNFNTFE